MSLGKETEFQRGSVTRLSKPHCCHSQNTTPSIRQRLRSRASPEVVLGRRTVWVRVGAVALCGGDPTVNRTALELAAAPPGGTRATPQAPAGAATKRHITLTVFIFGVELQEDLHFYTVGWFVFYNKHSIQISIKTTL